MTTNKRLLDAQSLEDCLVEAAKRPNAVSAAIYVAGEMNSGRLDAQPAEVNAPVDDGLIQLLTEVRPYIAADADAGHMLDGFKPRTKSYLDELVERIDTAIARPTSQWIPVSERLPERNSNVLFWHKGPNGGGSGWPAIADEWRDEHHLDYATHWMPLTPPPTRPGEEV